MAIHLWLLGKEVSKLEQLSQEVNGQVFCGVCGFVRLQARLNNVKCAEAPALVLALGNVHSG